MKRIPHNPYIVGNPIKTKEMFFGRIDEFQYVKKKIGDSHTNQIIIFCGNRRSGKTSILFQILSGRLGDNYLPVLVDMQILAGINNDFDLFKAILENACATLKNSQTKFLNFNKMAKNEDIDSLFRGFLMEIEKCYPGKILLLLLDEYELIEAKIRDGTLSESSIHYLSGILESPYRVSFVFTGSTNLEERKVEYWRSLLGKSIYRKISYLSANDTARLITEPLKDYITYTPDIIHDIYRLSGGQPFYTQVICQNMVDLLSEEERNRPDSDDLQLIVRDIINNPLPQMIYSWKNLPDTNKLILSALSSMLVRDSQWKSAAQIYSFLKKNKIRLNQGKEQIMILLEDNYHKEFLEKNEQNEYRFKIDLLRHWIKKEHSIWKVIKEIHIELKKPWNPVFAFVLFTGLLAVSIPIFMLTKPWQKPPPSSPPTQATPVMLIPPDDDSTDLQIQSNHSPFLVMVDENPDLTKTSLENEFKVTIPDLPNGEHTFVFISLKTSERKTLITTINRAQQPLIVEFSPALEPAAEPAIGPAIGPAATPTATPTGELIDEFQFGAIRVSTIPAGSAIWIDGKKHDKLSPDLFMDLSLSEHEIKVAQEGYRTVTRTIVLETVETFYLDIELEKLFGMVLFKINPTAKIYLNDAEITETPDAESHRMQTGEHILRIVFESLGRTIEYPVKIRENETTLVELDLVQGD